MTPTCESWDDLLGPAPQRERSHAVTLERVAQGAYRRPGSTGFEPFNKGNPGRPLGAKDKRPRQPRGWKEFMALAYAGRVGFDLDTRKVVLIDPDTHEPVLDEHGKVINPSYFDVAAEALYRGLQDSEIGEPRPRRHHTTGGRVIGAVPPQTTPRVDPAAYHGGKPGGPFVKGNPGRPRGAVDRVPREPRGWRGALPKMYARLARFDPVAGRRVLLDPETGEPAIRGNGEMIYDPSEIDLFAAALYYGLQDPKYAPHFMQFWFKFMDLETATA